MVPIEDYDKILKDFPNYKGRTIRGEVLHAYVNVETILSCKSTKPGCSCSYRGWAEKVHQLYDKWEKNNNTSQTDI